MELGIVIGLCSASLGIVGTMIALMFWMRGESNGLRAETNALRKEFVLAVTQMKDAINEMKLENKDFHFRLLEIERERNKIIKLP
jgi:hypothetical protein